MPMYSRAKIINQTDLIRVSRQIRTETSSIFAHENVFRFYDGVNLLVRLEAFANGVAKGLLPSVLKLQTVGETGCSQNTEDLPEDLEDCGRCTAVLNIDLCARSATCDSVRTCCPGRREVHRIISDLSSAFEATSKDDESQLRLTVDCAKKIYKTVHYEFDSYHYAGIDGDEEDDEEDFLN